MYPDSEGTQVIVDSMKTGYDIYPKLPGLELATFFRHKCVPIPLGHSDRRVLYDHWITVRLFNWKHCYFQFLQAMETTPNMGPRFPTHTPNIRTIQIGQPCDMQVMSSNPYDINLNFIWTLRPNDTYTNYHFNIIYYDFCLRNRLIQLQVFNLLINISFILITTCM